MNRLALILCAIGCTTAVTQAAPVYEENFDAPAVQGRGATGSSNSVTINVDGITAWSIDVSATDLSATSDWFRVENSVFEARDVDGEAVWFSQEIDISGLESASFSLDAIESGDHEGSDYFDVSYSIDGQPFIQITNWNGLGSDTRTLVGDIPDDGDWGSTTVTQSVGNGSTLVIRVAMNNGAGSELMRLDNVIVQSSLDADQPPQITGTSPTDGADFVSSDVQLVIDFNEPVDISSFGTLSCSVSGEVDVEAAENVNSYILTPAFVLTNGDDCSFTVFANDVTDRDGAPDTLAEDFTFSFSVDEFPLIINEALADPATSIDGDANNDGERDSSDDEFIELVNISDSDLDISGWTLADGASVRHTFPEGTLVASQCAIVVFGGGLPLETIAGAEVQTASSGALGLNNGGDTITIEGMGASIAVAYSGALGGADQSFNRSPDISGQTFERHSTISGSNAALFSPGTLLTGGNFAGCKGGDTAPQLTATSPESGAVEVNIDPTVTLEFNENVALLAPQNLQCTVSGSVALASSVEGSVVSLSPTTNLNANEVCSLLVAAGDITDTDGEPNALDTDISLSFTTVSELLACDISFTPISLVQGSGFESPFVNGNVSVQAVVTSVNPNLGGYFIQEEDSDTDGDPLSSEGIFVRAGDSAVPSVGEVVAVRGLVVENFGQTEIQARESAIACGNATVSAASLTLPFGSADEQEQYEGMLVETSQQLTVSDNFVLGRFGEFTLSNGRLFQPTNVFPPSSAEAIALAAENDRNQLVVDDGRTEQNLDFIPYPTGGLSANNSLRGGDSVAAGLTGVVNFRQGNYLLVPTVAPQFITTNPRTETPQLERGNLVIASVNVLNFFNGDGQGNFAGSRGADTAFEFERQADKIVSVIVGMDADVVGLQELENDGYGPESAIVELVERVNAVIGEGTYQFVDPGTSVLGEQSITNGILFKPATVTPVGGPGVLSQANSPVDENEVALFEDRSRPSFTQVFALNENGREFAFNVNHLRSKGPSCANNGDPDVGDGQGHCNITRTRAIQAVTQWLDENYSELPIISVGDLNSYTLEDPLRAFEEAGYTNLTPSFRGIETYTTTFFGEAGALDHALANENALASVIDSINWNVSVDEPIVLDFNTEFKSEFNINNYYDPGPFRASDHDPVVVSLQLESESVRGDWDGDGDVDITDVRAFIRAIQARQQIDDAFDLNDDGVINILDARVMLSLCTRTRCATE